MKDPVSMMRTDLNNSTMNVSIPMVTRDKTKNNFTKIVRLGILIKEQPSTLKTSWLVDATATF